MTLDKTLDRELESYEKLVKIQRPVDYGSDIMFASGIGFAINMIPEGQYFSALSGMFVTAAGLAIRMSSAYMKWYYHPENSDIRERVESGEGVNWMEVLRNKRK